MKVIYIALMEQLKTAVPELRWVDLDEGQIDGGDERPAIAFPAVLTGIALTRCETLYDCVQHCVAAVTVRIVQNPFVSRTAATVTDDVRTASLERYALVERIHAALQNFSTEEFNPLSRLRQAKETRRDGLFVYRIEYQTEFRDDTEG